MATSLLALLVSFLGATLISSFFMVPISDLGEGIAAIRQRDAVFRIPRRRPDEFGFLADAFNLMIEQGARFTTEAMTVWQDCGVPAYHLATNRWLLDNGSDNSIRQTSK
jgi:methyl-accepting chemotaxis protein